MKERLLLDTHVLLWCLEDSSRLSQQARKLIDNPLYTVYVSAASIWEISIKQNQGKLQVIENF